ncbi:hypothetical protein D3C75_1302600 [compost metagenome]
MVEDKQHPLIERRRGQRGDLLTQGRTQGFTFGYPVRGLRHDADLLVYDAQGVTGRDCHHLDLALLDLLQRQ